MQILRIEHQVADFDTWKRQGFDADPIGRARMGVRRHEIARAIDDPNYVAIDLEFENRADAEAMEVALRELWRNPLVGIGAPQARILEAVEIEDYG